MIDKLIRVMLHVDQGDHSHDFIEAACHCPGLHVMHFDDESPADKPPKSDAYSDIAAGVGAGHLDCGPRLSAQ